MENDKRLIDANTLEGEAICLYSYGGARYIPLTALKRAPTVDAVEVVHCKDCKHMEITPDNLRWCNAWNSINGMGDDGFCNYGERRGE